MIQAGAMNSYVKSNAGPLREAADRQRHLEGSSCGRVADYRGSTMDNTNYEDIGHLPHACHTQLKRQLCCSYTYMGSARGANLFLQAPGDAPCLHLMRKQILYGPRSDS